jgi:hypothetical protein
MNFNMLREMAIDTYGRATMVHIVPPEVRIIGLVFDPLRTTPVMRYLKDLVRRKPDAFPETILFMDVTDRPNSRLPLFGLMTETGPEEDFPLTNLMVDDTYLSGFASNYGVTTKMITYSEFVMNETLDSWAMNWTTSRLPRAIFHGSPTHRIRRHMAKSWRAMKNTDFNLQWSVKQNEFRGRHVSNREGTHTGLRSLHASEYLRYQIGIAVRGKSASSRDKYYFATANALLRLVDLETEPSQFFHDLMIPYVHYLPVWYSLAQKDHFRIMNERIKCVVADLATFLTPGFNTIRENMGINNRRLAEFMANKEMIDTFTIELVKLYHETISVEITPKVVQELSEIHLAAEKLPGGLPKVQPQD